jgi:hypothetical protein
MLPSSVSWLKPLLCLQIAQLPTERCGDFQILSHGEFYPVSYYDAPLLFNDSSTQKIMDETKDSFGVHIWNARSRIMTVNAGSQQPYSLLAATNCPRMYAACGGNFWWPRGATRRQETASTLSGKMLRKVTVAGEGRVRASVVNLTHCDGTS